MLELLLNIRELFLCKNAMVEYFPLNPPRAIKIDTQPDSNLHRPIQICIEAAIAAVVGGSGRNSEE